MKAFSKLTSNPSGGFRIARFTFGSVISFFFIFLIARSLFGESRFSRFDDIPVPVNKLVGGELGKKSVEILPNRKKTQGYKVEPVRAWNTKSVKK